ncbi:hypothetical protein [Stieleria mannarensis]|uniref:hypothetical protein n=1 Tax=Stieleria mannarensis TaxID=2755585 RepID=UPI0015FFA0B1|nr:hypothetical protein [Rhodopirellula sp. JC639]
MNTRSLLLIVVAAVSFSFSLGGCSESKPTSVTEDADQAAIDAYKEMEKQIELETMGEMEEDDLQ